MEQKDVKDLNEWDIRKLINPWSNRISIYSHILSHINPKVHGLIEGGEQLPDENYKKDELKWVAGGRDNILGNHGEPSNHESVNSILSALEIFLKECAPNNLENLYSLILENRVIDYAESLTATILRNKNLDPNRMSEFARWLAEHAPDREPVKFAIILLSLLTDTDSNELLIILGRHEEFTLYVTIALLNRSIDKTETDNLLFSLAQNVFGWGRINIVENLRTTTNDKIKHWLLREGYKNSIMYEYLVYTCAVTGEIDKELKKDKIDQELLTATGDIIQGLINGGPAESMDDYDQGSFVIERYIHFLGKKPQLLEQLITIQSIQKYLLEEDADWQSRTEKGWTTEFRKKILVDTNEIIALPYWKDIIKEKLHSDIDNQFYEANEAAKVINFDVWSYHFEKLKKGTLFDWFNLLQTDDPVRIDLILDLAEKLIPLDNLSTGVDSLVIPIGSKDNSQMNLNYILQALTNFPGKGWVFIKAGLQNPLIRNRFFACNALLAWKDIPFPNEIIQILQDNIKIEVDKDIKVKIEAILKNRQK